LAREFDRGFSRLGASGREIDAAALAEIRRSESEQALGKSFGGGGMELRRVGEGDLRSLFGHCATDFGDSVTDADDGGLAGCVEETAGVGAKNPGTFAAHGDRQVFAKIPGEQCWRLCHESQKL
jgi:hypothetical protein